MTHFVNVKIVKRGSQEVIKEFDERFNEKALKGLMRRIDSNKYAVDFVPEDTGIRETTE